MDRIILHSDLNNFYASVECMYDPSIRNVPVAVAGDEEARHGIVLAKNYIAKSYGVATGDPLWKARQKCRDIVFVPPHYDRYIKYSRLVREIYGEYTDQVESFGLDECWLDVTGSTRLFGDGKTIADTIRCRIRDELGLTVSVGVSYNKIFAKLGSDMKKPDATTVITREHFREKVWPLPVSDLLYVGRSTHAKLKRYCINTIGDLAAAPKRFLSNLLGKNGIMLWEFANGLDTSPVSNIGAKSLIKSVGNGTTAPRDLVSDEDVRIVLYSLCEHVSERLRRYGFVCSTVQLSVRDCELYTYERQEKLTYPNRTAKALFEKSFGLYKKHHKSGKGVRSLTVRACDLFVPESEQLSLMPDIAAIQRREELESTEDKIRKKYGSAALRRGIFMRDPALSGANMADDRPVSPGVSFMFDPRNG